MGMRRAVEPTERAGALEMRRTARMTEAGASGPAPIGRVRLAARNGEGRTGAADRHTSPGGQRRRRWQGGEPGPGKVSALPSAEKPAGI
jgi:hypothetical protein